MIDKIYEFLIYQLQYRYIRRQLSLDYLNRPSTLPPPADLQEYLGDLHARHDLKTAIKATAREVTATHFKRFLNDFKHF